jgi:ABC-type nitrate/sulfonate/bicarbonate transport system substrate-binding protein/signal transduction histidine kinase
MKKLLILIFLTLSLHALVNKSQRVSLQVMWLEQFQFAGYIMAKEKGFYRASGLEVDIKKHKYSLDTVDEVLSGRATFGVGRSSLIKVRSEGKKVVLISAIFQSSPFVLISLKSSNIKSVKDLKNKTLMLTKDITDSASIHAMILANGLKEKDIYVKEHTFDLNELIEKKVDLYAGYVSNEPYLLDEMGIKYNVISPKNEGFNFYSDILFTSQKEVDEHPEMVKSFKEASLKGWKYAFEHIEESVKIIYNDYNPQHKSIEALTFEANKLKKLAYIDNIELGNIDEDKVLRIFDIYKLIGLTNNKLDIKKFIFNSDLALLTLEEKEYLKNKKQINICVLSDSLPYSAIRDEKYVGIGADILELTHKYIQTPYKLVPIKSWMESFKKGTNEKCDLLPIAARTPSRDKLFNFTTPYHFEPLVVVMQKSKNYFLDFKTILDRDFAIVKGQSFIEKLKLKYPNIKLHVVKNTKEGLLGVKNGKYDAFIDALMGVAYELKDLSIDDLKIAGQLDEKVKISFGIKKDEKMLFDIFEKVSKKIKPQDIQKLLNEWVAINYTQNIEFKYLKELVLAIVLILAFFFYRQYMLKKQKDELMKVNESLESKVLEAVDEIVKKDSYLLQQSRLAQMGEMLSMIAHQWKQPLSSISTMQISMKMAIELEQYDFDKKEQRDEFLKFLDTKLDKLGDYTQNLSHIISDFSDFYKPNKKSYIKQLDDTIQKALNLIDESLNANSINLTLELNSKALVRLHESEFMQVILNILNNAKEQLLSKRILDPKIHIRSYDKNNYSIIEILDNAGGIDEAIMENIFDPYYSTKMEKNGTGLGLYMSKKIIQEYHNGSIYAMNTQNGAMFVIKIKSIKVEDTDEK